MLESALLASARQATKPTLQISLLGPPSLVTAKQQISIARRQSRALLYRIAASPHPVPRDQLCFLLWPDIGEGQARRNLTVLLTQLRRALPSADTFVVVGDAIGIEPGAVEVDTTRFLAVSQQALRHGQIEALADAVHLYRGPFLDGFDLPAAAEFGEWLDQERQTWERRYLDALAMLVEGYSAQGAYPLAIEAAQRALSVDELAEDMHRRLIELYAAIGDRSAALRQFERCVTVLERDLGVSPLPETRSVYEHIRDGRVAAQKQLNAPQIAAAQSDGSKAGANTRLLKLPAATAPLIGRTEDLAYASAMLIDPTVRLLTLCGAGGSGKTRLAQQIAWDVADLFTDGAVFVPLAALRDPALVPQVIAGMCECKQTTIVALGEFLRTKHMLLVLDNCEHLLEAGPAIAALLGAAPNLHILATSRAALNLQGEHTVVVPPLPLPDLAHLPTTEELASVPAVALLLARTQALNPRFQLSAENAGDLAAICVRLDGLPLAIELAAARLKLLPPRDLLRRLDRSLTVLTTGSRDLPDRQQTLRATIDWSYRLLDTDEQLWFERCSIFAGGWTMEAAEALNEQWRWPGQAAEPLDALAALVDKSLVQASTDDGTTRFMMLETIREFAAERLRERGGADSVARAHADYFQAFVEQARPYFHSPHVAEWAGRVQAAHDNIRAALQYFLESHDHTDQLLQLGTGMYYFWHLRGYYGEGLQWLERVLAASSTSTNPLRASILSQAGFLATSLGQIDQATALFEACLAFCETIEAPAQRMGALNGLGIILDRAGDPRGVALMEQAVALSYQQEQPAQICAMLRALANALVTGGNEIQRGIAIYEEALQIAREHKFIRNIGLILSGLGEALIFTNQYDRALPLLHEGLAIQQELGMKPMLAWTSLFLGTLHYMRDEWEASKQYFGRALQIAADLGALTPLPDTLEGIAGIAAAQGKPILAARLLGAAETVFATLKMNKSPCASAFYDRIRATTSSQLSERDLQNALESGRALSLEQAIAEAKVLLG